MHEWRLWRRPKPRSSVAILQVLTYEGSLQKSRPQQCEGSGSCCLGSKLSIKKANETKARQLKTGSQIASKIAIAAVQGAQLRRLPLCQSSRTDPPPRLPHAFPLTLSQITRGYPTYRIHRIQAFRHTLIPKSIPSTWYFQVRSSRPVEAVKVPPSRCPSAVILVQAQGHSASHILAQCDAHPLRLSA